MQGGVADGPVADQPAGALQGGGIGVPRPVGAQQPTVALDRRGWPARLFFDPHRAPARHRSQRSGGDHQPAPCWDHLRVAAAGAGWHTHVAHFPNPNDLDHLPPSTSTRRKGHNRGATRADAFRRRRTDRLLFAAPLDWLAVEMLLQEVVDPQKSVLQVVPESARPKLAEASQLAETLRREDPYYHAGNW